MHTITKQFAFSSAHQLEALPPEHKCARLHGHNYIVEIVLESETLNDVGFIVDYGDLSPLKVHIDQDLDHRNLNDIFDFYTTSENLAKYFFDWCKSRWPQTAAVRVSETPKTWAEYRE